MYVHGDNLRTKKNSDRKYSGADKQALLAEIISEYEKWKAANLALKGPLKAETPTDQDVIRARVALLKHYKDFVDEQRFAEAIDSRSNLHSSVLEEFMYYLFRDLVEDLDVHALIGKSSTYKDGFFQPPAFKEMLVKPYFMIERKDHDFVIGSRVKAEMVCEGSSTKETHLLDVPAIAIECKTYLDKTMLEGSSTAAEQLKARNPNAMYIVVSEWLKLSATVNLKKYRVDQIYVLRKQKNTDREFRFEEGYDKKDIDAGVVFHLFTLVRNHLTYDWQAGIAYGLDKGYLL